MVGVAMNRQQRLRALETEQRFGALDLTEVASATVLLPVNLAGVAYYRGAKLSKEILDAIKPQNLRALAVNGYLEFHLERKEKPDVIRS
jgi:hypothetical protein